MARERVVRGTSIAKTYSLSDADSAAPLGPPGVGTQAVVNAEMVHAVTKAVVVVPMTVLENIVNGVIRNEGLVAAALASDPALPVGIYRVRFHVTYPDDSDEYFPSDEPFSLIVDQQPV